MPECTFGPEMQWSGFFLGHSDNWFKLLLASDHL